MLKWHATPKPRELFVGSILHSVQHGRVVARVPFKSKFCFFFSLDFSLPFCFFGHILYLTWEISKMDIRINLTKKITKLRYLNLSVFITCM